jgi:hypothetical protein
MSESKAHTIAVACIFGGIMPLISKLANPETSARFLFLLVVMATLFVYPVLHFWTNVRHRALAAGVVLGYLCIFAGVYWPREAKVGIVFKSTNEYIMRPKDRPEEPDWFVRVKVVTDTKLVGGRMFLTNITKIGEPPLPTGSRTQIGSYNGQESFIPVTVNADDYCYFGLFVSDRKGLKLWQFIQGTGGPAEFGPLKIVPAQFANLQPVPPGEYKVTISFEADNLAKAIKETYLVKWNGDMKDFAMSAE